MNKKLNIKAIYYHLLKSFIKKGKIVSAKELLNKIFISIYKEFKISFENVLLKIFLSLNTFVEVRTVRKRKRIHLVPVSVTLRRRYFLIVKWLIQSSLTKDGTQNNVLNFSENLKNEIVKIIKSKKNKNLESNSKKLKRNVLRNVKKNRSNAHFRW